MFGLGHSHENEHDCGHHKENNKDSHHDHNNHKHEHNDHKHEHEHEHKGCSHDHKIHKHDKHDKHDHEHNGHKHEKKHHPTPEFKKDFIEMNELRLCENGTNIQDNSIPTLIPETDSSREHSVMEGISGSKPIRKTEVIKKPKDVENFRERQYKSTVLKKQFKSSNTISFTKDFDNTSTPSSPNRKGSFKCKAS
jgi:hypothetical protein